MTAELDHALQAPVSRWGRTIDIQAQECHLMHRTLNGRGALPDRLLELGIRHGFSA